MSEYDEDQESSEQEEESAAGTNDFGSLPGWAQKQIKDFRKNEHKLRERASKAEDQVLAAKFEPDWLELVPEELASFEKKVEYLEKLKAKFGTQKTETEEQASGEQASKEEPGPQEKALAAVAKGPSAGTPGSKRISYEDYLKMRTTPGQLEKALAMREQGLVDED